MERNLELTKTEIRFFPLNFRRAFQTVTRIIQVAVRLWRLSQGKRSSNSKDRNATEEVEEAE